VRSKRSVPLISVLCVENVNHVASLRTRWGLAARPAQRRLGHFKGKSGNLVKAIITQLLTI
jgi:hypothetical protein